MTADATRKLTQGERTAITRRQILDAAVELLYSEGYAATTTLRIQEVAGVSRGRLLHQFPSRDVLLVAAVEHLVTARVTDLSNYDDWPQNSKERIDRAVDLMWHTYQQPYFWAATELWLAARSNEQLRQVLLPHERDIGLLVRASADSFFGEELCARPNYPMLRELLNAGMRGIALTYALDPRDYSTDPHLLDWRTAARLVLGA